MPRSCFQPMGLLLRRNPEDLVLGSILASLPTNNFLSVTQNSRTDSLGLSKPMLFISKEPAPWEKG